MKTGRQRVQQILRRARRNRDAKDMTDFVSADERRAFRLPLVYADDAFLATGDAAWLATQVPLQPWGFLDERERQAYFFQATGVFDRQFPSGSGNAGHLLLTNTVYSSEQWERDLVAHHPHAKPFFARYVRGSREALDRQEFFDSEIYLFTRLGDRGPRGGIRANLSAAFAFLTEGLGLDDAQPGPDETQHWTTQADQIAATLGSSWLHTQRIDRRGVEWVSRHLDTPAQPTPEVVPADDQAWSYGRWRTILSSYTEEVDLGELHNKRLRAIKFTGPSGTGTSYAAFLPVAYCPDALPHNAHWMHHASRLDFPVDLSLHFEIVDAERAEKELGKPIDQAEAQQDEDREAGYQPDDHTILQQRQLREVMLRVKQQRLPLAFWQAVFIVSDTDPDRLTDKVTRLIKHYKDMQFALECPPWDQRELYYQCHPGSDLLVKDWIQRTDAAYLAAGMPWLTTTVGDNTSLYQGFTLVQDSNGELKKGVPVLTDLLSVVEEQGKAPTEVVCAEPGYGKRLALTELIPTADGFKRVGDVEVGDTLFDERGHPCRVTTLHPVEANPRAYRVVFDDGTAVLADAEHRWTTETRASRQSASKAGYACRRATKGTDALLARLERIVTYEDPATTTTPTLLLTELGEPGRDVYLKLSASLTPIGTYVQRNHQGGGRRYPLYSKVAFAQALLEWAHEFASDQRNKRVLPQTRTTQHIRDTLHTDDGRANHSIPVTEPVQFPQASLPVDPYILGAWLGDGRSNGTGSFTTSDPEILQEFESAGFTTRLVADKDTCQEHYITGLVTSLRPLGVLNNKHIPDRYLTAAVEQRLALLQGLMDTNGTVNQAGSCEFYASDERLAHQVRSLVASLGMKARLRSKPSGYTSGGVHHDCKTAFTVVFAPNQKVVRLQRKLDRLALTAQRSAAERRYITAVEPIDAVPMRCITVDSPSHLYLCTDQFVPTHNTVSRGLKCALEDALRNVTQFIWDPKGDFLPLYTHRRQLQLGDGTVRLIDLGDLHSSVSLDAFALAEIDPVQEIDDRETLAGEVLARLCAQFVDHPQNGLDYRNLITMCVATVLNQEAGGGQAATMQAVLDMLGTWRSGDFSSAPEIPDSRVDTYRMLAYQLHQHLVQVERSALGRLLFRDPGQTGTMQITPGTTTIFVAMNLRLPEPAEQPTTKTVVSDVICGLMTDYIRSLISSLPHEAPKSAVFDEWHVIRRTSRAEALADWLRRMGRSRTCQVRQLSQSANDFRDGSLSTVWAGGVESNEQAKASCELLNIEPNNHNIDLLKNLGKGQFLFRDIHKRVALVQVDIWDSKLFELFETQAKAKAALRGQEAATADGAEPAAAGADTDSSETG